MFNKDNNVRRPDSFPFYFSLSVNLAGHPEVIDGAISLEAYILILCYDYRQIILLRTQVNRVNSVEVRTPGKSLVLLHYLGLPGITDK